VVDINPKALDNPELTLNDPYGEGWLLTVDAPDAATNFRNLLGGTVARRWMDEAAARLRSFATPAGALAQDGGVATGRVIDLVPEGEWDKLRKELFLV
jgi:hypothetical protein